MRPDHGDRTPRPIPTEGGLAILDDFQELQRKVADAARRRDRAAGERAAALRRLQEEFGCADEASARKLLSKLERDERKLAQDYAALKSAFEKDYAQALNPS